MKLTPFVAVFPIFDGVKPISINKGLVMAPDEVGTVNCLQSEARK